MKKIILLGVLVLGLQTIGFSVNRERREPCAPYNNERTLSQVEEILMWDGVYYDNYRYEIAKVYNSIADYRVSATKDGMREMIAHSVLVESSFVNPEDYENGVKVGDHIEYTNLTGRESQYWLAAVDENGKIIDVYMKVNCLNIQKRKHLLTRKKEKLREAIVIDTIWKTTHIYDTICHIEYLPYQTQQEPMLTVMLNMDMGYGYQQPYYAPCQPIFYGGADGGYTNIVNNYTYNITTNNYSTPKPDPVDPGKPAPVPGHEDGPRGVPGHDELSTSGQNGGSPRNVPSSNYEETFTNKSRSLERTTANDDALASTSRNRVSNEKSTNTTNSNARSISSQSNNYEKEWERKNQERVKVPTSNSRSSNPNQDKQRESVTDFSQGNSSRMNMRSTPSGKNIPTNPSRTLDNNQGITKASGVGNGRKQGVPTRPTPSTQDGRIKNQGNTRPTDVRNPRVQTTQPAPTKSRPIDYGRYEPQRNADPSRMYNSPPRYQPQKSSGRIAPIRNSGSGHSYSPPRGSGSSHSNSGSHRSGRGR